MAKLVLDDLSNLNNTPATASKINANNAKIEQAIENTLSRDGTSPNQMGANLDMNGHRLINLPAPQNDTEPLRKGDIAAETGLVGAALNAANDAAEAAAASAAGAAVSASSAATSAGDSADSAAEAATSATAAATSASDASDSADAAAASAAEAAALAGAAASAITFTPAGTIAATNVQAAIAEAASEAVQVANTSSFGRSLIAASDAPGARNLLGMAPPVDFNSGSPTNLTSDTTLSASTHQSKFITVDCTTVATVTLPTLTTTDAGWSCVLFFQGAPVGDGTKVVPGGTNTIADGSSTTITSFYTPGLGEILGFIWTGAVWIYDLVKNSARTSLFVRPTNYTVNTPTAPPTTGWQSFAGVNYSIITGWMANSANMSFLPKCSGLYEVAVFGQLFASNGATTSFTGGVAIGATSTSQDWAQSYQYYFLNNTSRYESVRRTIRFSAADASSPVYATFFFDNVGGRYLPSTLGMLVTWLGR